MSCVVINNEQHKSLRQAEHWEEQVCDKFCLGVEKTVNL